MGNSAKFLYAQSSDIKGRSFLEYRRDMKKKAIFELEIVDWINELLRNGGDTKLIEWLKSRPKGPKDLSKLSVRKSGGDSFLWFARDGKSITREPDFRIFGGDSPTTSFYIELQYAETADKLDTFDFKVSKVGKKKGGGEREPHQDRIFLYIIQDTAEYAFVEPQWIMDNGEIGSVAAWGDRPAYRVPKVKMSRLLKRNERLRGYLRTIEIKTKLLYFQYELLEYWKRGLASKVERVIERGEEFISPEKGLDDIFWLLFVLRGWTVSFDNGGIPYSKMKVWLSELLNPSLRVRNLRDLSRLLFSIDYLYYNLPPYTEDSLDSELIGSLESRLLELESKLKNHLEALYRMRKRECFLDIQRCLFAINILEDIKQDAIYYFCAQLKPTNKIFEIVPNEALCLFAELLDSRQCSSNVYSNYLCYL